MNKYLSLRYSSQSFFLCKVKCFSISSNNLSYVTGMQVSYPLFESKFLYRSIALREKYTCSIGYNIILWSLFYPTHFPVNCEDLRNLNQVSVSLRRRLNNSLQFFSSLVQKILKSVLCTILLYLSSCKWFIKLFLISFLLSSLYVKIEICAGFSPLLSDRAWLSKKLLK